MKCFTKQDIESLDRIYRLNLINSVSGYKPANLIGTKGESGENLSIISSVVHLGSNPALLGFIMRPTTVERHTFANIIETHEYTINQVEESFIQQAHYTSANFDRSVSEFETCKIEAEYKEGILPPFVQNSRLKMLMRLKETIPIEVNGTMLIVGSIERLYIDETSITENGQVNLNKLNAVAISGLNRYHKVTEIAQFPYARPEELPDFKT